MSNEEKKNLDPKGDYYEILAKKYKLTIAEKKQFMEKVESLIAHCLNEWEKLKKPPIIEVVAYQLIGEEKYFQLTVTLKPSEDDFEMEVVKITEEQFLAPLSEL